MRRLNVWIHSRVMSKRAKDLLNYQEKTLLDVAKDNVHVISLKDLQINFLFRKIEL